MGEKTDSSVTAAWGIYRFLVGFVRYVRCFVLSWMEEPSHGMQQNRTDKK